MVSQERQPFVDAIKAEGGIYEASLTSGCTHLIALQTTGAKYRAAMGWRIPVLSFDWLKESIRYKMRMRDEDYALTGDSVSLSLPNADLPQFLVDIQVAFSADVQAKHREALSKKVVEAGGCAGPLSASTTHYLVGDKLSEDDRITLQGYLVRPHIVQIRWVRECIHTRSLLEPTEYIVDYGIAVTFSPSAYNAMQNLKTKSKVGINFTLMEVVYLKT